MVVRADDVPGPKQGRWRYEDYAAIPDDGRRTKQDAYARAGVAEYWLADPYARMIEPLVLDGGAYQSLGAYQREPSIPSQVLPNLPAHVEQFFV